LKDLTEEAVGDDPKLLDDSGEVPKFKDEVGDSIPDYEIVSLLDRKTCQVAKCLFYVNKKKKKDLTEERKTVYLPLCT